MFYDGTDCNICSLVPSVPVVEPQPGRGAAAQQPAGAGPPAQAAG